MITRTEVRTYEEHLMCDQCGEEMKIFISTTGYAGQRGWGHKCPNGHTAWADHVYPRTVQEPK